MEQPEKATAGCADQVFRPCGRAFFVYYVAMALCFFGPMINPQVGLSRNTGIILGLILAAAVVYFRWGQEYRLTALGVSKVWRWPSPRRQDLAWEDLGEVALRRGLTQSALLVGNLLIKSKAGEMEMFWFGLADAKGVQALIEERRS